MKSADPQIPPADLGNEEIHKTVVTNPYWEKTMLLILMVTEMMMLMMAMTMSMEIMMLDGPICEKVLQILDMTIPKPGF